MLHRGVDFKAPKGTPILATADGTVEFADEEKRYGLKVVIQHDGEYKSLYAHMSEIKVQAGQQVKKGTVIGLVGSSGLSTAPHLHYEIIKNGKAVNPADYLPKS
jgi:murein DD-endopeptidase MepM/ murein hydrolase activator NlpD